MLPTNTCITESFNLSKHHSASLLPGCVSTAMTAASVSADSSLKKTFTFSITLHQTAFLMYIRVTLIICHQCASLPPPLASVRTQWWLAGAGGWPESCWGHRDPPRFQSLPSPPPPWTPWPPRRSPLHSEHTNEGGCCHPEVCSSKMGWRN